MARAPLRGGVVLPVALAAVALAAVLWPSSGAASSGVGRPSASTSLATLRPEYLAAWDAATVRPEKVAAVDRLADTLLASRPRYEAVERASGVPWYVVAAIHSLEGGGSSGRFTGHLHNGDPLSARTVHVPAGRPLTGSPPFTWEASAADALSRWRGVTDWSLGPLLGRLEAYNGWRTRTLHRVWTPYLWSFTTLYSVGKYVSDGVWSATAVSAQVGAAALLKRLEARGAIRLAR